ncbi:hypothetical protein BN946_scf184497.g6 [Trametes cinnabarina]|uniref:Anaphase-promoting complex subunit 4 WD40 domain-containing protein n=1 Tax=Pycnoporus cinnabarinus TaxID=5643 RepID=A0A060SLJ9_PYCCI|nr:hypothetical protein BN946_scf184497.g6 [Trametes cinnabarina]
MARLARYFPGRPASTLLRFISGIQEPSDASQQPVFAASITPTGEHVVVVRADRIQLLNVSSGDCERSIQMDRRFDSGIIGWSHAGDFVAFRAEVDDDTIYVCNTNTGRCITLSTGHQDVVVATLFSQDKQEIVSASKDGTIRRSRWNNHVDGRPQTSPEVLFRCDGAMTAMAVSPDKTWIVSASADYSPPDTSSPDLPAKPSNEPYGRNGIYPVLRLHKSSGGVVWIEHHERPIVSLAFSDDGTRVLAGTLLGKIFLYDLTELIDTRSDQSAPPATHPSAILENAFDSGSNLPLPQISFSPDGRAIITPRSCTPLDVAPARPLPKPVGNASSFTTYFIDGDGWLWRVHSHSAPRRICWVPSALRPMDVCGCSTWSAQGNTIACNAAGYKLVLLDMSRC